MSEKYWEGLEDPNDCTDPIATNLNRLIFLRDNGKPILDSMLSVISSTIDLLNEDRIRIIRKSEQRWSDILSMLDEFTIDDESSWETARRICDFYKKHNTKE